MLAEYRPGDLRIAYQMANSRNFSIISRSLAMILEDDRRNLLQFDAEAVDFDL